MIMASPTPGGAAAPERAAASGKAPAPGKAPGGVPPGSGTAPRARHWHDDRSAWSASPPAIGLHLLAAPPCDAAHDDEENHQEKQKCQQVGQVGLVVRAL